MSNAVNNRTQTKRIKLEKTDRPNRIASFIDKVGEEREIIVGHNRRLRVKNIQESLTNLLATASSRLIGERIRTARQAVNMTAEELAHRIGITDGSPKNQICALEKQFRRHGIKTGTIYSIAFALGLQANELIPSMREILQGVEDALDWKEQKLGFNRWNILNEWRRAHGLKTVDKKYLYAPDIHNLDESGVV